jgi:hypothetical protein
MYVSSFVFFECFVWCVGVVWNFRHATYLYDNRDLFKNNLHKLEPFLAYNPHSFKPTHAIIPYSHHLVSTFFIILDTSNEFPSSLGLGWPCTRLVRNCPHFLRPKLAIILYFLSLLGTVFFSSSSSCMHPMNLCFFSELTKGWLENRESLTLQ